MRSLFDYIPQLREQAYNKSDFMMLVAYRAGQMFENICLIKYAKVHGSPQHKQLINHWSTELQALTKVIGLKTMKTGNTKDKRLKAIKEQLIAKDEFKNLNTMVLTVEDKFEAEGIKINRSVVETVIKPVINKIDELCELLADYSTPKLRNFIERF